MANTGFSVPAFLRAKFRSEGAKGRQQELNFGLRMMTKNGASVNFDGGSTLPCFPQGNFSSPLLPAV
jgi:hypothetical protein